MIAHQLPHFPHFRRFSIDDKEWYEEFYATFEPYSDFNFLNLLIWLDASNDLEYSELGGNIVFRFTDPFGGSKNKQYSLLGRSNVTETIDTIFQFLRESGEKPQIEMVPEVTIQELPSSNNNFITIVDPDNTDYILDAPKTAHLSGSDLRSLREDCNSFIRRHSEELIIKDVALDSENIHGLIDNLHMWDEVYKKTGNDNDMHESLALNTLFLNVDRLDVRCMTINIAGRLEGFVIYSYPARSDYVMATAVKVSYRYNDLYDFCVFAFANRASRPGVQFINFEQDLGIPGLREYKLSLKPAKFLRRYTVRPAN